MNGIALLLGGTFLFALAYFFYGKFIGRVLGIDPARPTPAHTMRDGVDFVPAHPAVLFGHHFASIAGAGPIVGPIAAAYFGWGPVVAWVVIGCIFIGAVHDMAALYLSVRHQGKSIASVIETVLGKPGRLLFLLFCWSTLILVCAEFTRLVAATFVAHPDVATSSLLFIALAVLFGLATNRLGMKVLPATAVFVPLMFGCVWAGHAFPLDFQRFGLDPTRAQSAWTVILLVYCFLASTLPVWILLQPRDYLNSYLLYATMALGFLGVLFASPHVGLEPFVGWRAPNARGVSMPLFPILFITIACGACSGFHSLIASGTSAKQIDRESHIRPVAYGGMLLEGVLALLALVAVCRFSSGGLLDAIRSGATPVSLFSSGLAGFCMKLGIPEKPAFLFMSLAVAAFLMTSVDSATRIARFTWQELFTMFVETDDKGRPVRELPAPIKAVSNLFISTALVVLLVGFLLLHNPEIARNLWNIFASANQLLAALTLLTVSLWMLQNHKAWWTTLFPMLFMLAVSSAGLWTIFRTFDNSLVKAVTGLLLALAAILVLLAIARFATARHRAKP